MNNLLIMITMIKEPKGKVKAYGKVQITFMPYGILTIQCKIYQKDDGTYGVIWPNSQFNGKTNWEVQWKVGKNDININTTILEHYQNTINDPNKNTNTQDGPTNVDWMKEID